MKYQTALCFLALMIIASILILRRQSSKTEVLKVVRHDGQQGEFSVILKGQAHYGLNQRELDSILIRLATDKIK